MLLREEMEDLDRRANSFSFGSNIGIVAEILNTLIRTGELNVLSYP